MRDTEPAERIPRANLETAMKAELLTRVADYRRGRISVMGERVGLVADGVMRLPLDEVVRACAEVASRSGEQPPPTRPRSGGTGGGNRQGMRW